ncbi:MAG TPA: GGDEF domain-containing protein [Rhodocyclaceae bacterium]|nr:GGDEF domain-containing protein [Rhodocyclaceae bacterium]
MNPEAIKHRLHNDSQLAVITLLGLIASLGVTPFAIMRLVAGEWAAFALDVAIDVGVIGGVIYAWITGRSQQAGLILAYLLSIAAVAACFVLGARGIYWLYPALLANFFLVDRRAAMAIVVVALAVLLIAGGLARPPAEAASVVATILVSSFLTYVFAHRTSMQRAELEKLASRDPLTGVFNRRALLEEIQRMFRTFQRDGRECGLLVLDLDHFKEVNDRLGHVVGDQTLVRFARLVEKSVRQSDRLFRFGGEEFVLLAPSTTRAGLTAMAAHLRRTVEQQFADNGNPLTVSIGGAALRHGEAAETWFERADNSLYAAKNAGRNTIVVDPDE